MKLSKQVQGLIQDVENSISAVEMELKLLEVQQLEIHHAIHACERAIKLARMLRHTLAGETNEPGSSEGSGAP